MAGSNSPSKKKGISGAQNAKHIPFRYGGFNAWKPPASVNSSPSRRFNRETVMGLIGGALAKSLGYSMPDLTVQLDNWLTQEASAECPTGMKVLEAVTQ